MRSYFLQRFVNVFYHLPKAILANIRYSFPSKGMNIICVTGTDGKTTTANMIYHILSNSGLKVGLISTISAKFEGEEIDTGFHVTSPEPFQVQKLLKLMKSKGAEWIVLETTSHALDQYRYFGIKCNYAVFTNITHEHLDYHKTYKNYLSAKAKLVNMLHPYGKAVLNLDDLGVSKVYMKHFKTKNIRYGISSPDVDVRAINLTSDKESIGLTLKVDNKEAFLPYLVNIDKLAIKIPIMGEYNVYNALAALSTCVSILGNTPNYEKSLESLSSFKVLSGRMEVIQSKPFKVIVDFAHTPNALEKALTTLRNTKPKEGRLIVVFGCAGKRDQEKRHLMGEVAGRLSDVIVITSEDPRDEELALINNRIIDGVTSVPGWNMGNQLSQIETSLSHLYFRFDEMSINSRIDAIKFAIRISKPNDIVVICGKGHEKSMCFETTEYPYSDQEVVKSILKI